ncbi:MAG: UDP-N-acetylmuramoyl-L-alanine--D-glutamate ligase [Candidatus Kryptoniota bacterium]
MSRPEKISGAKVSVIGAARSGMSVAHLLKLQGAEVFVSDRKPVEQSQKEIGILNQEGISYEFGRHTERVLDADFIVVSPGVPEKSEVMVSALKKGLPIYSELEVASWYCRAPIVAITGTNGKTTTTALTGKMFENSGRKVAVAGNIGFPLSDFVMDLDEDSIAVVETSSFQLDHIDTFKPHVGVWLNVQPDHLDRYESYEAYVLSKTGLFKNQKLEDYAVYNNDDRIVKSHCENLPSIKVPFSLTGVLHQGAYTRDGKVYVALGGNAEFVINPSEIRIRGIHNLYNSLAALISAYVMGVPVEIISKTLREFKGVEHRLEPVREINGVRYINDSKATNVDAVWYALGSFDSPVVLIAGGKDKGNDYSPLYEPVRKKVRAMILIGAAADRMFKEFSDKTNCIMASTMEDAVKKAREVALPGDVVLLSPACASFDMFQDYEHRGREFKRAVMEL